MYEIMMMVMSWRCVCDYIVCGWAGLECEVFFFKQKTAYERRISDWSSDVCSSDLPAVAQHLAVERVIAEIARHHRRATHADLAAPAGRQRVAVQIARASCRERVCQYV